MAVALVGFNKWSAKMAAESDQTFQCTVCYERVSKPIVTCTIGHLYCQQCSGKLPNCSLCQGDFTAHGNLALNNILESSHFPCKNKHAGCKIIQVYTEIKEHEEKSCNYKKLKCGLNSDLANTPCLGNVLLHEFKLHVEINHKRRVRISCNEELMKDVLIEFGQNIRTMELIEVYNEDLERSNFYLEKILYSGQKQMFCISYHFIGKVELAKNYTYKLTMVDSKDPNIYLAHKNHCLPIGLSDDHIQSSGQALTVSTKSLMGSLERRKLLKFSTKFDYVFNEKRFNKKKEYQKLEKKDLCEEISKKYKEESKESSVEEEENKDEKFIDAKAVVDDEKKGFGNNEGNEAEEDEDETLMEFSGRIIKTMFAPYAFILFYVILLYLFGK